MNERVLRFWKIHADAKLPTHGKAGDIGYDLFSVEDRLFVPGQQRIIRIGVRVVIPNGYYGRVAERSGMAARGFSVGAGVIDPNYRGELMVILRYPMTKAEDETLAYGAVSVGQAIAQLILERADGDFLPMWENDPIPDSNRGEGRFNSSGR